MTSNQKTLLGIASVLPLVGIIAYVGFFLFFIFQISNSTRYGSSFDPSPEMFLSSFVGVFIILGLVLIASIALMVIFIINATQNPLVSSDMKILWILLLVLAGTVTFPIYWYLYIRPDHTPPPVPPQNPF